MDQDRGQHLEPEGEAHEPGREERAREPDQPSGARQLRQQRAARGQEHDDGTCEAGLGRGRAKLALETTLLLHRGGAVAEEARQVAPRAALEQAARHEHVHALGSGARPQ